MPSTDVAYNNPNNDVSMERHKFLYIFNFNPSLKNRQVFL